MPDVEILVKMSPKSESTIANEPTGCTCIEGDSNSLWNIFQGAGKTLATVSERREAAGAELRRYITHQSHLCLI